MSLDALGPARTARFGFGADRRAEWILWGSRPRAARRLTSGRDDVRFDDAEHVLHGEAEHGVVVVALGDRAREGRGRAGSSAPDPAHGRE